MDVILYFSHDNAPNIAMVIPAMDHIDSILATNTISSNFSVKRCDQTGDWTQNLLDINQVL